MTYNMEFSRESDNVIRKLDKAVVERILKKLEEACGNPYQFFERLSGREDSKLRVGDYRIIARVMHSEKIIFIVSIGHRKNIYKN